MPSAIRGDLLLNVFVKRITRTARRDVDLAELAKSAQSIEKFVERIKLKAPEGEPLRLEHDSFVAAIRGETPVVVTGEDGRDALAVALRIVDEIGRSLHKLRSDAPAHLQQQLGSA